MFEEDVEDEEDEIIRAFENGYWVWNDDYNELQFISYQTDEPNHTLKISTRTNISTLQFKEDVDFLEQIRFRRCYQRRLAPGELDVITVQDIKDLALFTAPITIQSPILINYLHTAASERLIRALIFYMQYYLQVADKMTLRNNELATKIRTEESKQIEAQYEENLCDLRLLVAKEWSVMLIGGEDYKKFHHMGDTKRKKSTSENDAKLYETMQQMLIRIVWLALARNSYNRIELEINRLFKTDTFNTAERTLQTRYLEKMTKNELRALLGSCTKPVNTKIRLCTPMIHELFCKRNTDYRLLGVGVINYPELNARLFHMAVAICFPEEKLCKHNVTVGILGLPRMKFDVMLRPLPTGSQTSTTSSSNLKSKSSSLYKLLTKSFSKSKSSIKVRLYPEIILPPPDNIPISYPEEFPVQGFPRRHCSEIQRGKWLNRLQKRIYNVKKARPGTTSS